MSKLKKLAIDGGSWDAATETLVVTSQHSLTQAAGYLKFALSKDGPVYFRGQPQKYPTMMASVHRGTSALGTLRKRVNELGELRNKARYAGAFITATPEYAHDALLQHYGIRTNWLDVVDNLWVALWFACHNARAYGRRGEYLHFERRQAASDEFAFIALIQCGATSSVANSPGLYRSGAFDVIDLRTAAPSLYLRPHAQHGLLIKRRTLDTATDGDLMPQVVGWIAIPVSTAQSWLGRGDLLSVHSLFPPPHYDVGLRRLLDWMPDDGLKHLGSIHHIGA